MSTISMPVVSFRRLKTPFDDKHMLMAVVHIDDLPDFSGWRQINPRRVRESGHVVRAIEDTLQSDPNFLYINRGLVVTVNKYRLEQHGEGGTLHLELTDENAHGLLDGGHTYHILTRDRDELGNDLDQYVKVEILSGFGLDEAHAIVAGRNTSMQVQPKSLANLEGAFDELKKVIQFRPYADNIAYVENDEGNIDVREIISFLYMFTYEGDDQPMEAYTAKAKCLADFEKDYDNGGVKYRPVYPIAHDIFCLWDHIHKLMPDLYKDGGGRFGGLTGIRSGSSKRKTLDALTFLNEKSMYKIPAAYKYPILASFRAFIEYDKDSGAFVWGGGIDPFKVLDSDLGAELVDELAEHIKDTRNPTRTGRDKQLWRNCHLTARNYYLEARLRASDS